MKRHLLIGLALLALGSSAPAALYTYYWDGINAAITNGLWG